MVRTTARLVLITVAVALAVATAIACAGLLLAESTAGARLKCYPAALPEFVCRVSE